MDIEEPEISNTIIKSEEKISKTKKNVPDLDLEIKEIAPKETRSKCVGRLPSRIQFHEYLPDLAASLRKNCSYEGCDVQRGGIL